MYVQITVYTLTTDNDCGLGTAVYGTEKARDNALWNMIAEDSDLTVKQLKRKYHGDVGEARDGEPHDMLDSINWDDLEVAIPIAALIPGAAKPKLKAGPKRKVDSGRKVVQVAP